MEIKLGQTLRDLPRLATEQRQHPALEPLLEPTHPGTTLPDADRASAARLIEQVPRWMEDYNTFAPHSSLGMKTPANFAGNRGQLRTPGVSRKRGQSIPPEGPAQGGAIPARRGHDLNPGWGNFSDRRWGKLDDR